MAEFNCYVCGSDKVGFLKNVDVFAAYRCRNCGLIWIGDVKKEKLENFYNEKYYNNSTKIGYQNYLADEINHRANAVNLLETVSKTIKLKGLKILDVGCAHGFLLDEARKRECEVFGVELSKCAYEYAKNKLKLNVFNSELNYDLFAADYFDVVFLVGTIEHLRDPDAVIDKIKRIIKKNGLLVITTINTGGLLPLFSIKPPEHLFYFNKENLLFMLGKYGFKETYSSAHYSNYFLYDIFHRLKEFTSLNIFQIGSGFFKKNHPRLRFKIPTNEMLLIVKKS
ncbi:MAG: class I SAM-dependent methyltransferase [Elusimicrobia bacterium]|nr:class I SAM-dependent methyltransferase [Elusimicrobiota bacterium]